jgi:uncharacterized protein YbaR (Trm112 family)
MSNDDSTIPIAPDLLEILRDPAAVQQPERFGPDAGQLELVRGCWLVSKDTGYKYPIRDGIPVMLIEEGQRWQNTPVDELPVPPLAAPANAPASGAATELVSTTADSGLNYWVMAGGLVAAGLLLIGLWRILTRDRE